MFVREAVTGDSSSFSILPIFDDVNDNSRRCDKDPKNCESDLSGIVRLQSLLYGYSNSPSHDLLRILEDCSPVTVSNVLQRVTEFGNKFTKCSQLVSFLMLGIFASIPTLRKHFDLLGSAVCVRVSSLRILGDTVSFK